MLTKFSKVFICYFFYAFGLNAQTDTISTNYFYKQKNYGSEALYNPFSFFLNAGYDITQLDHFDRSLLGFPYKTSAANILYNLRYPNQCINQVGWWRFAQTELLPLTYSNKNGSQWIPNYLLHTIGGGMSFTTMSEWYRTHDIPYPKVLSFFTVASAQFMNEVLENTDYVGYNLDPISDIYVFNTAGFILFSIPAVNQFFSEQLQMADWSLQPTLLVPELSLYNSGQYFSFKYHLPFTKKWSLFSRVGMGAVGGLSYKIDEEFSLSFGAGARPGEWILIDSIGRQLSITTPFTAGVFLDKNNSLMASMVYSDMNDYFLHFNIYPGIIKLGKFSPGIWGVVKKDGTPVFGITSTYFIGLGGDF